MATFVARLENADGGLVLSDQGFGLNYLDVAEYVEDVEAPSAAAGYSGTNAMFKRYEIESAQPIAFFLPLTDTHKTGVVDVSRVGDIWSITAFNESGADGMGFGTQAEMVIHVFARPEEPVPNFGLKLWDELGDLSYWLGGDARPLLFVAMAEFEDSDASVDVPEQLDTVAAPAFFGFGAGFFDPAPVLVDAGLGRYSMDGLWYGFTLDGAGHIVRTTVKARHGPNEDFGVSSPPVGDTPQPATLFFIEADGL